ncbi:hypothetical protein [Gynuella sunshinyii]|uniref:GTPase n=1 Tax=Gynuella sunshinyii YC6258 TaxID=1445510 RepID=A0A0C5VM02_9GAMM|nr:hypothetical protein [Gynuella sunshinyii]AJQ94393.1 hypothetical Protein YC6258_02355 [Gynuella sunshinyii YC6258]
MDSRQDKQYLQVPRQTLTTLSFCEPTARQLNAWVSSLPMANIGETARQLYHAVIEFNQLRLSDQSRFELLELVRGPIYYICNALNNRYLLQTVVLDENQRKIANLAQALQTHLAIGYKIILAEFMNNGTGKAKEIVSKSLHRVLADIAPNILRSYQLYLRTPPGIWRELHQLYQFSVAYNLTHYQLADDMSVSDQKLSVKELYCRTLLLGTCQPNQLHQRDLSEVYGALELWASDVQIEDVADERSTLIINPESDSGPIYRHLLKPQTLSDYMGLNTTALVRALHASQSSGASNGKGTGTSGFRVPEGISAVLINHLIQSWGGMKQRTFSRSPAAGEVEIAVGLIASHYHLSGQVGFYQQLYHSQGGYGNNPFIGSSAVHFDMTEHKTLREHQDVWEESFDAGRATRNDINSNSKPLDFGGDSAIDVPRDAEETPPKYIVSLVNTSPRGYCVRWQQSLAANVQTGEIIVIRENNANRWNLGIIRWIRQAAKEGALMGVELIAPNARPSAIRLHNKTGQHGDYMRAMIIPEIRQIGQPISIIVPRMPFQVGHKVGLNIDGREDKYQLIKRLQGTSAFNQYQIKSSESKPLNQDKSATDDDGFESLWRQL